MPSVKLSPIFNDAQLDDNGLILSGGKVYWYLAGTTTPTTTYSDTSGSTAQSNPVVLNVRGEPDNPIWLSTGQAYKAILKDSLDNTIRTVDNISGINDTSAPIISEWVLYPGAASYINTTTFSVTGDQRATFTDGRRVKATVSGVDKYATINGTPVYGTGTTTVVLTIDGGGVLDSSLNSVYYGFLDPAYPSFDTTGVNNNTKAGIQSQTWTAFTTGGSSGAYTLTPSPAISSLSAGQRFRVKFHATGNGTDTIAVNGLTATTLKQYSSVGVKEAPRIFINQLADVEYDGTDFVILDPITPVITREIAQIQYLETGTFASGSTAIPVDDTIPQITEGDQYMSVAITPTNASSTIEIEVVFFGSENSNTSDQMTVALFKDSGANAIAAGSEPQTHTNGMPGQVVFRHRRSAGSTSAQTYTVRAGLNNAAQLNFNGGFGGAKLGGVFASSLKITEYTP